MNKLYDRQTWHNNAEPALNETQLNLLSKAVDDIDDRVIEIADDVLVVVPEILDKYADIEALATNPPYIGNNGHWWTWDTDTNQYVDSGVDAGVSVTVGTTTTLPAGSSATVTNSGTDTDPILNFGIPQGVDGQDGVSPEVTITTITDGHTVTITDADHPTGQSFNVMDGQDGAPGVGVPSGGTTGQVLKKVSGTDYDTEWANESGGGSGGHTIINSAGTSMTQRTGLQFEGMYVTDDSTNDKTKVSIPQFTQAGWDALSSADKAKYNGCTVIIKDDYGAENNIILNPFFVNPKTCGLLTKVPGETYSIELTMNNDGTWHYVRGNSECMNVFTMAKIDVTGYSSLSFEVKNKNNGNVLIGLYPAFSNSSSTAVLSQQFTNLTGTLNISSITGSYYIAFAIGAGTVPYNCDIVSFVLS